MAFPEPVDRIDGKAPFQFLSLVSLGLPVPGLANRNVPQIFPVTASACHCHPTPLPNASTGPWVLPKVPNGKPETGLRFTYPPNARDTPGATEPCLDGWAYNPSTVDSVVTEVCPQAALLPPPTARIPHPAMLRNGTTGEARVRALGGRGTRQAERKDLGAEAEEPKILVSSHSECKHLSDKRPVQRQAQR